MPRVFIADSEDEDDDERHLSSPPVVHRHQSVDGQGTTVIDLSGADDDDAQHPTLSHGATSSTDPVFFQSVLDEQTATVHRESLAHSTVRKVTQHNHSLGHAARDSQTQEGVSSSEMTAPGTFQRTVTAFDASAVASSTTTNPATQRQLSRMSRQMASRNVWDIPSSPEMPQLGGHAAGLSGSAATRSRDRPDEVDLVSYPPTFEGREISEMPSTLPVPADDLPQGVPGCHGGSGDTEVISTDEKMRRLLPSNGLPSPKPSTRDSRRSDTTAVPVKTQVVDDSLAHPMDCVDAQKPLRRRRRDSSPDIISHAETPVKKSKRSKRRQTSPVPAKATSPPSPRESGRVGHVVPEPDVEVHEVYAEDDYDDDFTDKPTKVSKKTTSKKKRGRPKKTEMVEAAAVSDDGPMAVQVQDVAVKRGRKGRPRKSATVAHVDVVVDDDDDFAEGVDHEATNKDTLFEGAEGQESVCKAETQDQIKSKDTEEVRGDAVDARDSARQPEETALVGAESTKDASDTKADPKKGTGNDKQEGSKAKQLDSVTKSAPGKPLFRVGLSKRSRIAPLLKSLKKT